MKKRIGKIIMKVILILIIMVGVILVAGLLFLNLYPTIGDIPGKADRISYADITKLYYDGQFHDEKAFQVMTGKQGTASERKIPDTIIKADKPDILNENDPGVLKLTWFGHSSSLIQLGSSNVLIDPVLEGRASPVSFVGPKRFAECPVTVEELPEINVLFISHDHYDHLEYSTIKKIHPKVKRFIVPLGIDRILTGWGVPAEKITALNWWEEITLDGVSYALTPSQHYTGRNPLKANSTFWGGLFMNDGTHKVYYTGDGGYYDVFSRIYEKYGAPDLMLADSGQYDPAWSMTHMFPEEAVQAAMDVQAKWYIPVHWGAFSLSNHAWDDPIIRAKAAADENNINMATPRIGQTVDFDLIGGYNECWWE